MVKSKKVPTSKRYEVRAALIAAVVAAIVSSLAPFLKQVAERTIPSVPPGQAELVDVTAVAVKPDETNEEPTNALDISPDPKTVHEANREGQPEAVCIPYPHLDFVVKNSGGHPVTITSVRIKVVRWFNRPLRVAEVSAFGYSASYGVDIDKMSVGEERHVRSVHVLQPGETDRFLVHVEGGSGGVVTLQPTILTDVGELHADDIELDFAHETSQ